MRRRGSKRRSLLETALRGGVAGVAGGLAITVLEREVVARLTGIARHRSAWDDLAARGLSSVGLDVGDGRGRIAAGVATQIVYAGALGAAYAVLRERARGSRAGRIAVDSALTLAATLVFPDRKSPKRRSRRLAVRRKIAEPLNPADTFVRVTGMALGAILR